MDCGSLYDCLLALRGWQHEEINGNKYELNSIITEKWEGKAYRLVIQRERRMDGEQDLWEGEYTYRCILTNGYFIFSISKSPRQTPSVSFYPLTLCIAH